MQKNGYFDAALQPLPGDAPCGQPLDYEADFILLQSRLQPRQEIEYGNFVEAPEPLNWREIESDCLKLIGRSKDIRLIIALMRCRLRQVGLIAVEEGLITLLRLLKQFPDDLYPQLIDEGEFEPVIRANALAELEDNQGFLADLRQKELPRALGMQITIKALEKSKLTQHEGSEFSDAQINAMLDEWQKRNDREIAALQQAGYCLKELKAMLNEMLGEQAPTFSALENILKIFTGAKSIQQAKEDPAICITDESMPQPAPEQDPYQAKETENDTVVTSTTDEACHVTPEYSDAPQPEIMAAQRVQPLATRADALSRLQEVRAWFISKEPSSPVILLLEFTEKMIGMRFTELVKHLPSEMIARLEGNDHQSNEE
ncbi:ImpA family type VI secretion system protein [Pantoea osteomyelitidis]